MKNPIYLLLYISMIAFSATLAGCSESEDLAAADASAGKALRFEVGPYPAFAEGTQTRTVGTFDAGKTSWEAGDQLLVEITTYPGPSKPSSFQHFVLTYNGETWSADKDVAYQYYRTIGVHTTYSPGYEFVEGESSLVMKEGVIPGTFEQVEKYSTISQPDGVIPIDFSDAERRYSRLRMAGEPGTTIKVYTTGFQPNGTPPAPESYTFTTDEKGNAYLYGYWPSGSTIRIVTDDGKLTLLEKRFETDLLYGWSYVADITPTYKSNGDGTAENPYRICLPQQLASLAEAVNSGTFAEVDGGIHVALESDIDLSGYPDWTPIGRSNTHPFVGTFDGQGHTISGLTINNSNPDDEKEWGLFGMVQDATIQFVRVDGSITLSNSGNMDEGGYSNKDGIGGIAGRCSGTVNFYGCHNNVDISGTGNSYYAAIGGIVGFQIDGHVTLIGCANTGKLQALGEGNASQIPTAGFIGTAYRQSNTQTVTAEANYCNAEIRANYMPCVFFSDLNVVNTALVCTVNSNYWMKVNDSPLYVNVFRTTDGFTEVNGSDVTWQTAKDAMNECLSTSHSNFGYQYVENTGEDKDRVPLILKSKTTEP